MKSLSRENQADIIELLCGLFYEAICCMSFRVSFCSCVLCDIFWILCGRLHAYGYASLFNCTTAVRASDSMTAS